MNNEIQERQLALATIASDIATTDNDLAHARKQLAAWEAKIACLERQRNVQVRKLRDGTRIVEAMINEHVNETIERTPE